MSIFSIGTFSKFSKKKKLFTYHISWVHFYLFGECFKFHFTYFARVSSISRTGNCFASSWALPRFHNFSTLSRHLSNNTKLSKWKANCQRIHDALFLCAPLRACLIPDKTVWVMRRHLLRFSAPAKHQSKLIMMLTKLPSRQHLFTLGRRRLFFSLFLFFYVAIEKPFHFLFSVGGTNKIKTALPRRPPI